MIGPTTDKVYFMHIYHDWDEFYGISGPITIWVRQDSDCFHLVHFCYHMITENTWMSDAIYISHDGDGCK